MRLLTNPGANLPPELVERYSIALTSSTIVVDGEQHDCRSEVALQQVDRWVEHAHEHPYVLGTSAAEFVGQMVALVKEDPELLVVMSSRKIIQSYEAALSAVRTLDGANAHDELRVRVVDSLSTDLGLGLLVLAGAEAARAQRGLDETADLLESMAACGRLAVIPRTIENLVRGGKASFLRGWMANMLGLRPILSFVEGEVQAVGKCSSKDDHPEVLAQWFSDHVHAKRVWVGIMHGDVPDDAARLLGCLRERFEVSHALVRPTAATVYLHVGPGALGAVVYPLDDLPSTPLVPAPR
jgi:DegV family protein with EDD domain